LITPVSVRLVIVADVVPSHTLSATVNEPVTGRGVIVAAGAVTAPRM
jgi:hypothetical protein